MTDNVWWVTVCAPSHASAQCWSFFHDDGDDDVRDEVHDAGAEEEE